MYLPFFFDLSLRKFGRQFRCFYNSTIVPRDLEKEERFHSLDFLLILTTPFGRPEATYYHHRHYNTTTRTLLVLETDTFLATSSPVYRILLALSLMGTRSVQHVWRVKGVGGGRGARGQRGAVNTSKVYGELLRRVVSRQGRRRWWRRRRRAPTIWPTCMFLPGDSERCARSGEVASSPARPRTYAYLHVNNRNCRQAGGGNGGSRMVTWIENAR